ncbi:MAG: response regulator, partial [Candidatus Nitrosomaritimum yanchengensis]
MDDSKSITNSLEKYLKVKGHEISSCNEGHKGLTLIQNDKWDKILLDLSMPEFSGLDIIENLEKIDAL